MPPLGNIPTLFAIFRNKWTKVKTLGIRRTFGQGDILQRGFEHKGVTILKPKHKYNKTPVLSSQDITELLQFSQIT